MASHGFLASSTELSQQTGSEQVHARRRRLRRRRCIFVRRHVDRECRQLEDTSRKGRIGATPTERQRAIR